MRIPMLGTWMAVGLLLAAGRAQAKPWYAYAAPTCAPWDGPAYQLILQDAPVERQAPGQLPKAHFPRYSVNIWKARPPVGTWIRFEAATSHDGSLIGCPSEGACAPRAGRVRFDRVTEDHVSGELRVELGDHTGRELVLPFDGPFLPSRMFCG